ncbi:MAG: hypothetical protein KGH61_02820 [Candidatus Micrarchaeota archaeon]|nr:hypothetical protein [Candidatus Micrarchaeota archaeon]MDE1847857.1 hypothetical protein [Candidatus Micrarchaeota archaeon]MDE1864184.1 hypothetical protein [Candidatus Micrarchaeota archaeon]
MQIIPDHTPTNAMQLSDNVDWMIKKLRRNRDELIRFKVAEMAAKMLPRRMNHSQRIRLRSRSFAAN